MAERLVLDDMIEDNEFCVCSEGRRCGKGMLAGGTVPVNSQATLWAGRTDPEIAKT